MTLKTVHRPTRMTIPLTRPAPESMAAPPPIDDDNAGRTPLQFLLPIIGALCSVVTMVVLRNGQPLFLVIAAVVFVVAVVGGIGFAISSRGRQARQQRVNRELYLDYLEELRRDLRVRMTQARNRAAVLDPAPAVLMGIIRDPARLWERRRRDADFLTVRLGSGAVPWFDLSIPAQESPLQPPDPILLAEARLIAQVAGRIEAMPVTVDLRRAGVVAVIGDRDRAVGVVRSILLQLAAHHGPDDVIIAAAFGPDRGPDWRGLDLLPHVQDPTLFDGPVPARRVAPTLDALAAVLAPTLAERLQQAHATHRTGARPPRLVIVADDYGHRAGTLTVGAGAALTDMGITVLHVLSDRLDEPSNVDIRITVGTSGVLTVAPGTPQAADVSVDPDFSPVALFDATARAMAALRVSRIAEQDEEGNPILDIHTMLGIQGPGDVDPDRLWRTRPHADFLRVPFGADDQGNPIYLDLKESAQQGMGPHGICVGATGSGKSEMLRTLILSLALTHPPEDLSMILVDYKGGAAFAPFEPADARLPHLAGLIDNLADDPQLTTRARASIQGEVVRRQRLLKMAGSSPSITHYRELRVRRGDLPPMPHLFIVIDEFGELLTAEPEFIDLFLQIGRIGRSIGVHLLLSSQRLEGGKLRGLDSYLSYRLGMRTFSESESQAMLNTADAYHLPALPGYGFLKVDTSVYTRFRAGFVSGPAERSDTAADVESIPRPLALPLYNGIGRADSGDGAAGLLDRLGTGSTLIDQAVARLRADDRAVRPVWLPPLPARLALGTVLDSAPERGVGLTAILGLEDDPAQQVQQPWRLDLARAGGHVAVIGAPQSGRSTLLRTIVTSLALTHTPSQVAIYGMDLTGGLQRIESFPQVGGVATRLHRERLTRLIEELSGILAVREAAFGSRAIDSMAQLRLMHAAGDVPEIGSADVVLIVDGYGLLRQDFPQLEDPFVEIMVRAASFGVHCVLGMTRWTELRMGHQALFGTRIELRLNDPAESSIDRKLSSLLSVDTPGRALLDSRKFAQVALPVPVLVPDDAVADELEALAKRTARSWTGRPAAPIRLLPLQLRPEELPDEFSEPDVVPIGQRQDTMEFAYWDLAGADQHLLVLGDADCGKSTVLRTIASGLMARFSADELDIAVIDSRGDVAGTIGDEYLAAHAHNVVEAASLAMEIAAELEKRAGADRSRGRPRDIVLLVDDYHIISAGGQEPLLPLVRHLPGARDLGLHLVVTRPVAGATKGMYGQTLQAIRDTGSVLLMSGERAEGQLIDRIYPEPFPPGRGRFIRRGVPPHIIQVAQTEPSQTKPAAQQKKAG